MGNRLIMVNGLATAHVAIWARGWSIRDNISWETGFIHKKSLGPESRTNMNWDLKMADNPIAVPG